MLLTVTALPAIPDLAAPKGDGGGGADAFGPLMAALTAAVPDGKPLPLNGQTAPVAGGALGDAAVIELLPAGTPEPAPTAAGQRLAITSPVSGPAQPDLIATTLVAAPALETPAIRSGGAPKTPGPARTTPIRIAGPPVATPDPDGTSPGEGDKPNDHADLVEAGAPPAILVLATAALKAAPSPDAPTPPATVPTPTAPAGQPPTAAAARTTAAPPRSTRSPDPFAKRRLADDDDQALDTKDPSVEPGDPSTGETPSPLNPVAILAQPLVTAITAEVALPVATPVADRSPGKPAPAGVSPASVATTTVSPNAAPAQPISADMPVAPTMRGTTAVAAAGPEPRSKPSLPIPTAAAPAATPAKAAQPMPAASAADAATVAQTATTLAVASAPVEAIPANPAPVAVGPASVVPPAAAIIAGSVPTTSTPPQASVEHAAGANSTPAIPAVAPPRQLAAPVILPALQAFGAAMRQALADERRSAKRPAETPAVAPALGLAAPVRAAAIATTFDTRDTRWPQAMAQHIEQLRDAADASSTRIRLLPDALGPVDVTVRRDGDAVHVTLAAPSAETRQLLQDAQPRLADAAEQRGLKLASDVSAGFTDASGGGDRQPPRAPIPFVRTLRPAPASAAAAEDADDTRIA